MDNHTNVILYSKFSPASRKLIEMSENLLNFTFVCIDNKKIRDRISKSKNLNIKEVPCVVRIYEDTGYVESFEGDRAFKLVKSYIDKNSPVQQVHSSPVIQPIQSQSQPMQSQPMQSQPMQPQPMQPQPMQPQPMQPQPMQQIKSVPQQVPPQLMSVESSQVSQLLPESLPKQDSIQKQQKLINATSIEELGNDINKGQTMNTYIHVPKSVEFDIDLENRQRTVKTDRSVKESGNIVNRAMQMQKEREQESSVPNNRMMIN